MITSIHELYKSNAEAAGATLKFGDEIHTTMKRWLVAEGGSPKLHDSKNDLARKISVARGTAVKHGDSTVDIFRRLAGLSYHNSLHECLRTILVLVSGLPVLPEDPLLLPLPDFTGPSNLVPGGVTWTWSETTGALFYDFKYGADSNLATFSIKTVAAPTLSAAFTGLTPGLNYWVIRARTATGVTPWPLPTGVMIS